MRPVLDLNALSLEELFAELTRDGCLDRLARAAFEEDLGPGGVPGDVTAEVMIDPGARSTGDIVARQPGVLAGLHCIPALLKVFAPDVRATLEAHDGQQVSRGVRVCALSGPSVQVLRAERTLLNLLGRLSGVATRTAMFVERTAHTPVHLLDTRKTTPGLRNLEKYAVRCGGGRCHRVGLYDAVLIKDNHLAGLSDEHLGAVVRQAAERARARAGELRFVEVEVDRLAQLAALLASGVCGSPRESGLVDIVLLDNMSPDELRQAVRERDRAGASARLEASGGVTLETVRAIADTGVDRISVGGLTHQAVGLDFGLDFD